MTTQPTLRIDYERVYRLATTDDHLFSMFRGFESTTGEAVRKLRDIKVDLIICIPLKHGSNLRNLYDNLNRIVLPFRTGVLLGCENYKQKKDSWSTQLNKTIKQISNKFIFCTPIPMPSASKIEKDSQIRTYIRLIREIQQEAGVLSPAPINYGIMAAREELRIIVKQLICKFVLWFDADLIMPSELILRLSKHIKMADIVAGWTYNRHLPFQSTTVFTVKPFMIESNKDKEYYDQGRKIIRTIVKRLRESKLMNLTSASQKIIENEYSQGGYSIPPWYLERSKHPIKLLWAGFECAMTSKSVNDKSTFLKTETDLGGGEDFKFCKKATKLGYSIVVDPTCKCLNFQIE